MARMPRHLVLENGLAFHKVWRGHNREWNLGEKDEKLAYLGFLNDELVKQRSSLHALCLMSNHTHEVYTLDQIQEFSSFMRRHHGRYGQFFNKKHRRSGKVAEDRPHTSAIESEGFEMTIVFYIHANPVRAGMVKDAKDYVWSTHQLYAFGRKVPWMKNIKFPDWYMNLGRTMKERQKKYRELFDAYLREYGLRKQHFTVYGVGDLRWRRARRMAILAFMKERVRAQAPPQIG